jgi:hypothetical protein
MPCSIRLTNGWYLLLLLSFRVEPAQSAGRAKKLKTLSSLFQYQRLAGADPDNWVFRYEYFRYARDQYAPGHLHVRGSPAEAGCITRKSSLDDVHFPTGRVGIEAIIRLLVDDFAVTANEPEEVWRPLLQETEAAFIRIARQPEVRG